MSVLPRESTSAFLVFSHTIDPRNGGPILHRLASVTVVHQHCALADAWATALHVLGPEDGARLAEKRGLVALLIVREPDGELREVASPAFREQNKEQRSPE